MSQLPYTGESQRDEHNKDSNTKRVMLYGWDADGLTAVRLTANSDGELATQQVKQFEMRNMIEASSTLTYIGKEKNTGEWLFLKLDSSSVLVKTYATVVNNPSVTSYADAYSAYASLTYGDPTEAL